ncbi:head-tail adaptor protein [Nonomuraea sp. NBC_00507]|uniref:head-tail adaptor protein n=1 Tax=Nonomuraea sp. NBC_00507 TaxID=2976002 RepID=UPI002E17E00E
MIDHLLNVSLTHRRPVTVRDSGGGQSTTWLPLGTVRGRVSQPTSSVEREEADQHGADLTYPVYLGPRADVRRGDELLDVVGGGRMFEVLAVYPPSQPIYLRADCRLRQSEEEGL